MTEETPRPPWWGQRRPGALVRVDLGAGAYAVTLFVVTGVRPGPTLAVLGAVHGDEYEGPVTLANLLATLDPTTLAGTLIALPVANPPAYAAGTRTSPLDGLNLARTFPGRKDGTASERLAFLLAAEVIGIADVLIDLHSGGDASAMALLVGYPDLGDAASERSRALAIAFGAPVLWAHPEIAPGRTLSLAFDRGIPCLYTEAGGGGVAPAGVVRCCLEGLQRVLITMGMLEGPPVPPRHEQVWRGSGDTDQGLQATATGLFRSFVAPGAAVTPGLLLGEIRSLGGQVVEQIVASEEGVVALVRRLPRVAAGDKVFMLTTRVVGPD
jgi:predicted deacylase